MESSRGDQYHLGDLSEAFDQNLRDWAGSDATARLWRKDSSLWTSEDEDQWLAWLEAVGTHRGEVDKIKALSDEVREDELTDVLLLGMGGSSLCPEVLSETFGKTEGYPTLHVLDSTVPDQVRRFREGLDLARTLVIVASKSGSTVEPNVLLDYFVAELANEVENPGRHVVAVTDPGSALDQRAKDQGFHAVFAGVPEIGGRFSALSCFGLLPAGLIGVDLVTYLDRAQTMVDACREDDENPGVLLGSALGAAWSAGRDKVTLIVSPGIWDIGAWIEQLVAESTGKTGIGMCPVDQEPELSSDEYQSDRIFVYLRMEDGADPDQDRRVANLASEGQPTITIRMNDAYDLGAEFFRWEFATAVVGSLMRINPFDQPNVQESKDITTSLLASYESEGALTEPKPVGEIGEVVVTAYTSHSTAESAIRELFESIRPGDYFTISAYCDRTPNTQDSFSRIRHQVARAKRVATTLGYGPRFLHSTGQLHKGGQNRGVYLLITVTPENDLAIPGKAATFGILSRAQALGDFQALVEKGRRVVRVDLRTGLDEGLSEVESAILATLG